MAGLPESANIALLIDADNASPDTLEAALSVLAELGAVNIRRVYGNWGKASRGCRLTTSASCTACWGPWKGSSVPPSSST